MIGGRIWGWDLAARYLPTKLIDNPIIAIEYIKRMSNWDDNGGTPLIKTSGYGSFDDGSLIDFHYMTIARQVFSESKMSSDELVRSLCETFHLISRQDENGYECLHYMFDESSILDSMDIGDIEPGSLGLVEMPDTQYVYCEPTIKYAYDYASGAYTRSLAVLGVAENTVWNSDLTPGFADADGENYWNRCKQLYNRYREFTSMPSSLTDQEWIVDYDTALWKFDKILKNSTLYKFGFAVNYRLGRNWFVGGIINITLPHETNAQQVKVVINSITKDKKNNRVTLEFSILDDIFTNFYFERYMHTDGASTVWQETDGASAEYQEAG